MNGNLILHNSKVSQISTIFMTSLEWFCNKYFPFFVTKFDNNVSQIIAKFAT